MAKTQIDLDDEALEAARAELGTTTKVDTVNAALREVAARRHRQAKVAAARYLHGDPEGYGDDPAAFMAAVRPKPNFLPLASSQ
jgi:hypothetical protein